MTNKEIISRLLQSNLTNYDNLASLLAMAGEVKEEDSALSKNIALEVRMLAARESLNDVSFYDLYNNSLLFLAREHFDFDSYMLYIEKNRDPEEQFYLPRRRQFQHIGIVQAMQRLIDNELDILSISLPPGTGKGECADAKILTPRGFGRFGDLKVGDKVIAGSGNVATVLGVYPKPKMPVYDVIFDDGSKVRCSQDHIWHTQTRDDRRIGNKYRDVELKDMLKNFRVEKGKRTNYSIDYVPKIDCFEKRELLIPPYTLGALIGDGTLGKPITITTPDEEVKDRIIRELPDGYSWKHKDRYDYCLCCGKNRIGNKSQIRTYLEHYGLYGKRSYEKFIPKDYLYASYEDRLNLLRGLLDTDGYADKVGIEYSTSSEQLAEDVRELVHSLGGYCTVKKRKSGYKKDGKYVSCRDSYRVVVQFGANHPTPLYLKRKREAYKPKRTIWKRYIVDIQYVGEEETTCIYIDDPSHLYITDDYVITHNTTLGEFFISFVMGIHPNTPNLMSSFSGFMTRMFYDAVLNIITSKEYCWVDVFPHVVFESTNAKEEYINLGKWKPFRTLTCRPIHASLTGVTRCEGFLYCDDLVSGIEEALSKDRLDKLYGEYTTDLKSRKKMGAKEIHIATRWSVHDVIGRIQRQYSSDNRAEFIAVPDIDPATGDSNFNYDYSVGFDAKYFNDMAVSMDDVSYRCLFKNDPIEREGILYHPDELLRYLGGLPDEEPDAILAICDTKDTGTDYNALLIFYQYKERFYLEDCVFKNIDPKTLDVLNADMLVKHKVQQAQFESNKEGSRTADKVMEFVKEKGGRCHITKKYTTQNKETKIIVNSPWVKTHVYFKDESEYDSKSDYGVMMAQVCSYSQLGKSKHDDAVDALAMFALYIDTLEGTQAEVISRADLGF